MICSILSHYIIMPYRNWDWVISKKFFGIALCTAASQELVLSDLKKILWHYSKVHHELGGLPLAVHLEWLGTPSWHSGVLRASIWTTWAHSDPLKVRGGPYKILVASPESRFLFPFGLWLDLGLGTWTRACQ